MIASFFFAETSEFHVGVKKTKMASTLIYLRMYFNVSFSVMGIHRFKFPAVVRKSIFYKDLPNNSKHTSRFVPMH